MKGRQLFTLKESARLRDRLSEHLEAVFTAGAIGKHQMANYQVTEWQAITPHTGDALTYPCAKSAYHIWLNMYAAHRHAVLRKFQCLYAAQQHPEPAGRSTLVFCAVFVYELAGILTEAAQWPD